MVIMVPVSVGLGSFYSEEDRKRLAEQREANARRQYSKVRHFTVGDLIASLQEFDPTLPVAHLGTDDAVEYVDATILQPVKLMDVEFFASDSSTVHGKVVCIGKVER